MAHYSIHPRYLAGLGVYRVTYWPNVAMRVGGGTLVIINEAEAINTAQREYPAFLWTHARELKRDQIPTVVVMDDPVWVVFSLRDVDDVCITNGNNHHLVKVVERK